MTESQESSPDAPEPDQPPSSSQQEGPHSPSEPARHDAQATGQDEAAEVGFSPVGSVIERNAYGHNTIVVQGGGDFIGSIDGDKRTAVPTADITMAVGEMSEGFIEPSSFPPTVKAIEERRMALLVGGACGNRVTATVALHRTGHKPIVELPGALAVTDLVEAVERACKSETVGVLVDSIDAETLTSLAGFRLRHLHSLLSPKSAVVFTTRTPRSIATDHELPMIEGTPPDGGKMVEALAKRSDLGEEERERCRAALVLLPRPVSPATAAQLIALAPTAAGAEELVATVAGQSQALDEWLEERPEAKSLAALAAAACLDGIPSSDFDDAAALLRVLLEGEVEPPTEPPRFGVRERLWPAGVV